MKNRACICLMLVSLFVSLAAGTSASAQSNSTMAVEIPFDFYVGGREIPAGEYTITSVAGAGTVLMIRSKDGRETAMVLTNPVLANRRRSEVGRVIFNKYADQHFLSSVWEPGNDGLALLTSKRERNLRKELHIANANAKTPTFKLVTVVARLEAR